MPSTPSVIREFNDIVATTSTETAVVDLLTIFDDPFTTGLVANFELENQTLGDGVTNVVLYDQAGQGAPASVANFLNYVNSGAYANSIIHRSVPGFIIQGGGFVVDGLADNLAQPANAVTPIATNAPVQNEFSAERSNRRGTLAYAKIGNAPNSATSQWFFNLGDNSGNLDSQNGGFTVFGEVIEQADLAAVDAIAAIPNFNRSGADTRDGLGNLIRASDFPALAPAFTDVPLIFDPPSETTLTGDENLVRYRNITVSQEDELEFAIIGNTNPTLLNASIDNNRLLLDYLPGQIGTSEITVQATNLQGQTTQDAFLVTVTEPDGTPTVEPLPPTLPAPEPAPTEPAPTEPIPAGELNGFIRNGVGGNGPMIDLTAVAEGDIVTTRLDGEILNLGISAAFDNLIGLYQISDLAGGIDLDGDGVTDLGVGDAGYAQAAIANRVEGFEIRAGSGGDRVRNTRVEEFGEVLLEGGALYAPFLITQGGRGGFEGFLDRNGPENFNPPAERQGDVVAYFSFLGANPDGARHVGLVNQNVFAFEDLPFNLGRSDNDFNDAAFRLSFAV